MTEKLPPPSGDVSQTTKALLVDSWYDTYLCVVVLVRVYDGSIKKGQKIKLLSNAATYQIERIGVFQPKQKMLNELGPGEIGFFTASIKQVSDMRVGDTITDFELGVDFIGLGDNLTFGALSLNDTGNDTSLMFNGQELAIIKGVHKSDFTSNNFVETSI